MPRRRQSTLAKAAKVIFVESRQIFVTTGFVRLYAGIRRSTGCARFCAGYAGQKFRRCSGRSTFRATNCLRSWDLKASFSSNKPIPIARSNNFSTAILFLTHFLISHLPTKPSPSFQVAQTSFLLAFLFSAALHLLRLCNRPGNVRGYIFQRRTRHGSVLDAGRYVVRVFSMHRRPANGHGLVRSFALRFDLTGGLPKFKR